MTRSGLTHTNNFDLIRLAAAAQVAVVHTCEALQIGQGPLFDLIGYFPGVPIFFFVSGYLVSQSLEGTHGLAHFFRKRLLRVYPALLVCFAVSLALANMLKPLPWTSPDFLAWVAAQVTIAQFYNPDFMRDFGLGVLNGSLWTIPVEVQFYVALPLIYMLARRLGSGMFWSLAGAGLIAHGLFLAELYGTRTLVAKLAQVTLIPWLGFFLIGVLAQKHWPRIASAFRGHTLVWLIAYAAAAWITTSYWPQAVTGNRLPGPLALVLFGLVLSAAHSAPALSQQLLRGNDISYGLYLYHAPFINVYLEAREQGHLALSPWSGAFLILALTLLAAVVSWIAVERPALALKRRVPPVQAGPDAVTYDA